MLRALLRGARRKFAQAAREAGARLASYEHPSARGPSGEPLAIDVAVAGDAAARRCLVVISGTHGQEGFAGSAIQVAWLRGLAARASGVRVVLVHALNPWGFAHYSRSNENNVDLNRNFVEHDGAYPDNPGYDFLHPAILLDEWTTQSLAQADARFAEYEKAHGKDALFDSLARGQYTHADGLNYGGRSPEWSNVVLERILGEHATGVECVGLIDWHTGIGEYGKPFFLCFSDPQSPEFAQAVTWWGADRVADQRPHGMKRPDYRGLVFLGVRRFLGSVPLAGAVVEFGTRGIRMRRALRLDLWLKFRGIRFPSNTRCCTPTCATPSVPWNRRGGTRPCDTAWRSCAAPWTA